MAARLLRPLGDHDVCFQAGITLCNARNVSRTVIHT